MTRRLTVGALTRGPFQDSVSKASKVYYPKTMNADVKLMLKIRWNRRKKDLTMLEFQYTLENLSVRTNTIKEKKSKAKIRKSSS